MTVEKLSKEIEKQIITALQKAAALVVSGDHPNDALLKVATDNRFTPPVVRRMAEAMNVSKTAAHLKTAKGSEKAASFNIADPEVVISKMYPEKMVSPAAEKQASYIPEEYSFVERENFMKVSKELMPIPALAKKAEPYTRDPQMDANKMFAERNKLRKAAEMTKSEYRGVFNMMWKTADNISYFFRSSRNEPFDLVEKKAYSMYGEQSTKLMDLIYQIGNLGQTSLNIKRASVDPAERLVFDRSRAPYNMIDRMVELANQVEKAASVVVDAEDALETFEFKNGLKKKTECVLGDDFDKVATDQIFSALDDPYRAAIASGQSALGFKDPDKDATRREALSDVLDPQHESQMQSVRVKAMLNDFLSNDPALSGYDPHEVAMAYSQLAQLSPQVSQQPAVVRGLLRAMLQQGGVVQPFEAHQMSEIEKRLRGLQPSEMGGMQNNQ